MRQAITFSSTGRGLRADPLQLGEEFLSSTRLTGARAV